MKAAKRITLDDLSAHLQLSRFSVSRALTGKQGVSRRTREAVMHAARELGYDHPSLQAEARRLAQRQILLAIPRVDAVNNSFWIEVIAGAEAEARRLGWMLVTTMVEDGSFSDDRVAGTSGVLLAGRRSRGVLAPFLSAALPTVLIGYPHPGETIDAIHVAGWEAGRLIGEHLKGLGHRVIAFVTDAPQDEGRNERLRGCGEVFAGIRGSRVVKVPFDPEVETSGLLERVHKLAEGATAIICGSESVTLRVMWAVREAGMRVPADISVVGSTDAPGHLLGGITLTSMHTPVLEIGTAAMDLLAWRIQATDNPVPRRVWLATRLDVGESTGPAPR